MIVPLRWATCSWHLHDKLIDHSVNIHIAGIYKGITHLHDVFILTKYPSDEPDQT